MLASISQFFLLMGIGPSMKMLIIEKDPNIVFEINYVMSC